jgi:hypothetical protein
VGSAGLRVSPGCGQPKALHPPAGYPPDRGPNTGGQNTRGFDPDPAASERLAGFLGTHLPAAGVHDHTATCLYT